MRWFWSILIVVLQRSSGYIVRSPLQLSSGEGGRHGESSTHGSSDQDNFAVDMPMRGPRGAARGGGMAGASLLLKDLTTGQELKGGVIRVNDWAAFLDCRVAREGRQGRLMRVNALLHPQDVEEGFFMVPDDQAVSPALAGEGKLISRGSHVTVYVKDVFLNSGRFSVTMDPSITKDKVVASRLSRRDAVKRRTRIKRLEVTEIGAEKKATVIKVLPSGYLLDVGLSVPAFLPTSGLPEGVAPEDVAQAGALLQVVISEKNDRQLVCTLISVSAIPPRHS